MLDPKVKIETRLLTEADFEFSYRVKKTALGPYVEPKWGWDEDIQRRFHREHWDKREFRAICVDSVDVGTVWMEQSPDHWRFGEFYILPEYQGLGIGTYVLNSAIIDADRSGLPIRLEYLKWNPVGSLYRRLGFRMISENDTHYFMERNPKGDHEK
jgi:GNAT superfamily N-acetyltransferase